MLSTGYQKSDAVLHPLFSDRAFIIAHHNSVTIVISEVFALSNLTSIHSMIEDCSAWHMVVWQCGVRACRFLANRSRMAARAKLKKAVLLYAWAGQPDA